MFKDINLYGNISFGGGGGGGGGDGGHGSDSRGRGGHGAAGVNTGRGSSGGRAAPSGNSLQALQPVRDWVGNTSRGMVQGSPNSSSSGPSIIGSGATEFTVPSDDPQFNRGP